MATSAILFAVYFINPDKVKLEPFKIANMITLDLDGANNFPIVFLFVGLFNLVISVTFSALITVILTKIPFIGRIKIAPILYNENVFD